MEKVPLPPVSPFDSGEGFPYAPVDMPNRGDIWRWKVGRRFSQSGFFCDRFLYLPKNLPQPSNGRPYFGSIKSVVRYLQSEYPDVDIDAFLASFSWEVPVKSQFINKAKDTCLPPPQKSPKLEGEGPSGGRTHGQRKQKQAEFGRRTRRSLRVAAQSKSTMKYKDTVIDLRSESDGTSMTDPTTMDSADSETNNSPPATYSAVHDSIAPSLSHENVRAEAIPEGLDDYVNSLEDILGQPPAGVPFSPPTVNPTESRTRVALLQTCINTEFLAIAEIDKQINNLQAQRDQVSKSIEKTEGEIDELTSKQRMVFDCLPKVVREIQLARAQSSEWELKKKFAEEKQASILAKFAPLKGFFF